MSDEAERFRRLEKMLWHLIDAQELMFKLLENMAVGRFDNLKESTEKLLAKTAELKAAAEAVPASK
jgi:uncharacterized damage-inducible protein DinB